MKALTFPKSVRLLKPADYGKVFDDVQLKVPHRNFLILAAPNNLGHARVGLIFSKKNLRHAVQRNRIKRQVRETFRLQQDLPSLDIIVLGRQGLNTLENPDVRSSLNDIWRRVKKKYRQLAKTPSDANAQGNE
ncbi:MAG: ribonuclease P protein component [Gammaproteobacteria bacterium]|uniref:Ribonuclease P protein component n=1 Tax=Marinobacter litoralis TaxID=187981 RepID=A0A3M2RC81_9GAMM|nr:ribonuclease P protein component [Marinobacter litoralis]MBR9870243.1 ribonuclease P protein component [Gammaproteobacteria bacterium]RMJ02900.1 Ribonuclease P protein component [Marinobacter litoralis]